jgi:carbon monoxide dehydrogenase subunit G
MEIADNFRVSTPIDATWKVLLDIERIAPCMPGAQLQEIDGDDYRGVVKVKVGPITAQYKGTATLVEADESEHRILIDANGRDTRGQGNANASIVVTMNEEDGGTRVDVVTDLSITGKVAQFGRGVLDDVSAKLLRQFVANLERDVLSSDDGAAPDPEPDIDLSAVADETTSTTTTTASGVVAAATGPRKIESAEPEPIDLLDIAGGSTARRVVPIAVGAVVLFLVWRLLRRQG